jgi:hypothetical protein
MWNFLFGKAGKIEMLSLADFAYEVAATVAMMGSDGCEAGDDGDS